MTPAEWKQVEEALQGVFGAVDLRVDGYEVKLRVLQVKPLRSAIVPYVNGVLRYGWMLEECEERRRFFQRKVRYLYSAAKRADAAKRAKSRHLRNTELGEYLRSSATAHIIEYSPHWTSFAALRRHLVKENRSVELVKTGSFFG
jgi:hypothetical protein